MDEYISRKEAIDKMRSLQSRFRAKNDWDSGYDTAIAEAFEHIKRVPAADVHPVVHCKDCKHRKERHYEESGEKPYIKYECKFTKYSMSDEGFCSFGAKMDGDSE